jgi:Predicted secreted protein
MINRTRRLLIKSGLLALAAVTTGVTVLLKPLLAFAERNNRAFTRENEADALAALYPGQEITPSAVIRIEVHDEVENGAFVPVNITADLPAVQSIAILVEKNPNPLVANFNLGPACTGFIATRIKVAEPSDIIAIVNSQEKLYSAHKFVKVIEGGCG